jgi:hypothetical protein
MPLPQCPETIEIDAGLDATTEYTWQITDKFETVYTGTATTDGDGKLIIDIAASTNLPKGLFTHFSGAFYLQVIKTSDDSLAQFTIDTKIYNCIELLFREFIEAIAET